MTLILIRHAHRDTTHRELDNGLSAKGRKQAQTLERYFKKRFRKEKPASFLVLSSPKKRCVETLEPIAKALGCKVGISENLDEQHPAESSGAFERRCRKFLSEHAHARKTIVVCSHGDWIPAVIHALCGLALSPKKGSWTEFEDGALSRLLTPEDLGADDR